jgi:hypothetical protein
MTEHFNDCDLFDVLSAITIIGRDAQSILRVTFKAGELSGMISVNSHTIAGEAVARWRELQSAALAKAVIERASDPKA